MGLTEKSFQLSKAQIDAINQHFAQCRDAYASAGEELGMVGVKVEFEWAAGLGRFVTANFDGEVNGFEIEVAGQSTSA
jgi:hypothetical protein